MIRIFAIAFCLMIFFPKAWSQESQWTLLQAHVSGPIGPATVHYLEGAFDQLENSEAQALVIVLSTPGGLLTSTREIIQQIDRSNKPVITVVGPEAGTQAASAGSFILLAGHWATMFEGTNTGAASPVNTGGQELGATMKKKVFEDTKALMRSIAEKRGRNIEMAEQFVSEAISLTDKEALERKIIDQRLSGELATALLTTSFKFNDKDFNFAEKQLLLEVFQKRPIDHVLSYIGDPQVAYMLTSFGTLGIYVEILNFGLIFPGVFGVICLILGLISLSTLPVNIGFLALLLFGVSLLVAEVFVSGFGLLGLGGLVSFFLGSLYLFDEPIGGDYMAVVYTITFCLGTMFAFLTFVLVKKEPSKEALVGRQAICATDFIHGAGFIKYRGQNHKAISQSGQNHEDGTKVDIIGNEDDVFIVGSLKPK